MGKRCFVLAAPNPIGSFLLHCRLRHYLTHHPLSSQVYTSVSLLSRFSLLIERLFWINFPQMYLQFSKLTLILLFSAHVSIFSRTLYYLPVLTAAGTTCNIISSVNFITMFVFQFQIIYANFEEDNTLNRALWHPYSQLIQLNKVLFIITFYLCSICQFSVRVTELRSKPIWTHLKSKISSDSELNAIPKPRWYPLSFLNCFCNCSTKNNQHLYCTVFTS